MSLLTSPTPQTWTLRFKSRKTTIFLHINPLQTFSSIKEHLYHALTESPLKDPDTGAMVPLPDSPEDIKLGRCVNMNSPSEGFVAGAWEAADEDEEDEEEETDGKGKAKAKGKGLAGSAGLGDCPKGTGLRDNAVLAFRWEGDESAWDGEMWGVRLPTFEDAYGDGEEVV
ncbi:hypothetical protein EJ04DRAFT_541758 [Polyplosphaeria fusca]|uniref:Uncharacterized protein n=1 Tax=Polyplosphaeria fusca TaxID=682080 RepID=A0A9P4V2Q0_9PLEO|nr:hypothetical protein EJ04DRAFT_541758 [Polyplosphaeria fusca]